MTEPFHVIYVSDAKYLPYVKVSEDSLRRNASQELIVHIIDADSPEIAHRIQGLEAYHGSRATFARLLAPELFPDVDWALYLDGDTLGLGDVCEIFRHCDDTKLLVGSRDPQGFNLGPDVEGPWLRERGLAFGEVCICAGVMLMNLKLMREERIPEQSLAFMAKYGTPPLVDQTVLNCLCRGRIGVLPPQWGVFSMMPGEVDFTQSAIIHFPQDLPWRRDKPNKLINDFVWLWWRFKGERAPQSWWRRSIYCIIKAFPWLVNWSRYLSDRLRPIRGLSLQERRTILSRWSK